MIPAHQRLHPDDLVRRGFHDRLVVQFELAFRQRVDEVFLQHPAVFGRLQQIVRKEAEPAAPAALGGIEREIGVAHQFSLACPSNGATATPTDAPMVQRLPSIEYGCEMLLMIEVAMSPSTPRSS
jgi:hypothetical protein